MKKAKKTVIVLIVLLVLAGAASGGVYAYQKYQSDNTVVEVVSLSNLNIGFYGDSMTSGGEVSDNYAQKVYAEDSKTVKEIKVAEGDEVKIGDPLLVYDMQETELKIEMKRLEITGTKNDITLAKREIERLKKIKPVANTTTSTPGQNTGTTGGSSSSASKPTPPKKEPTYVQMQVQKKDGDAYNYIDKTAKPYQGDGTVEEPYRFLCTQECYVLGEYLNWLVQKELVASFEIWSGNSVEEGALLTCWTVNGMEWTTVSSDSRWLVATQEKMEDKVEIEEPETETQKTSETSTQTGSSQTQTTEETYTADELRREIADKESELKELEIKQKSQNLDLKSLKKAKKASTVKASINGVVRTVEDPEDPPTDGSPLIEIAGAQGLYVKGSISELKLDQIEVGQEVSANFWDTGQMYTAVITEISDYPADSGMGYYGEGNQNVSYYAFTAYIEDSEGLSDGDYLELTISPGETQMNTQSLYIEKAYVREEDGRSYVLKAGEDGRLVKQYVQTGRTVYGTGIEIKDGLSESDRIAFPYGKTAKEGVKVKDAENGF